MKKKLLSTLLCVAMVASLVVGCGGSEETAEEAPVTEEVATEEVTTEPVDCSYPLDTQDTLTVWHNNQLNYSTEYASYDESPFHTGLAEVTGVEVEWQQPAAGVYGAADDQAYNLMLTEEVLPDIIFAYTTTADAEQLINDGVIYDLTEYLPLYAPDYWATITAAGNEDILQALKTDSGKLYSVGQFVENDYNITYVGPVVRQDWLDECGLDTPVTLEDWEEMLVAFKEKYGATFGFRVARLDMAGLGSGVGAYGSFNRLLYVDDNGQVQLGQAQPEWKEYMEILNKWYDMGLIDKDSVTMDDAAVRTKVLNGEIGASYTAMSQLTNWCLDAEAEGTGANWVGITHPREAEGVPTCMIPTRASRYQGWGAMVSTSCPEEKLITALQWLNYGYTEEGMMYWNYGTEGETYTIDADGKVQWTELVSEDPLGVSEAARKYTGVAGTGISIQLADYVKLKNSEASAAAVYEWIDNTEGPKHSVPILALTDEESVQYTDKMAAIQTYVQEMGLKFMTGDESLDSFDAYLAELDAMGLQECLEIQQAAYERYLAK